MIPLARNIMTTTMVNLSSKRLLSIPSFSVLWVVFCIYCKAIILKMNLIRIQVSLVKVQLEIFSVLFLFHVSDDQINYIYDWWACIPQFYGQWIWTSICKFIVIIIVVHFSFCMDSLLACFLFIPFHSFVEHICPSILIWNQGNEASAFCYYFTRKLNFLWQATTIHLLLQIVDGICWQKKECIVIFLTSIRYGFLSHCPLCSDDFIT